MKKVYQKISALDLAFIARNLSLMIKSGITESEALSFLLSQMKSKETKVILSELHKDVEAGIHLSKAMERFESAFGILFIHFIRIGERSGTLEETLSYLASQLERDHEISKRVKSAALYPAIIIGIVLIYAAVFAYVIFPRLENLYADFSTTLPTLTRVILEIAGWMKGAGVFVIAGIIIGLLILRFASQQSKSIASFFDAVILHTPGLKSLALEFQYARLYRIMGFLLKSGAPIDETLSATKEAIESPSAKRALEKVATEASQGKTLYESMGKTNYFSPLAVRLIDVAERSGSLESTFFYLSEFYDRNVDYSTKNLTSVLEPVLLILVGIAVALLAIAIILPIYQFSGSISAF